MDIYTDITLWVPALSIGVTLLLSTLWLFKIIKLSLLLNIQFLLALSLLLFRLPIVGTEFVGFLFHPLLSLPVIFLFLLWIIHKTEWKSPKSVLAIEIAGAVIVTLGAILFASNGTTRGSMSTFMGAVITPLALSVFMISSFMLNKRSVAAVIIIATSLLSFAGAYYVTYGFATAEWPSMEGRYSVLFLSLALSVVGILMFKKRNN